MISRVWHGWTSSANADAYETLLRTTILPAIARRGIAGYVGVQLTRREDGDAVEFVTTMWFETVEAVREFAGESFEVAVVPPAARALLSRFDERSRHYELVFSQGSVQPATAR